MSDHDDHEVLDEDRSPRSNGSHSPRPAGRSPSRSRSRSRSPPARRTGGGGRGGNSRSRSRSPGRRYSGRARSPVARRRSHYNGSGGGAGGGGHSSVNRENPAPSRCLGIFGLSMYTEEHEIRELFGRYGRIEEVKIVYDAQTARSRGFGFVYFDSDVDAAEAKERCNGINLGGRDIRVDFSVTQRAHTPTPGIYMGKKSRQSGGGGGGGGGGRGGFRRDGGDRSDRGYDRGGSGYGRSRDGGYGGGDRNGGGGGYGDRSGGYGGGDRGGFDRRRSPVGGASSYGRRSGGGGMRYSRSRSRSPPRQRHYR